MKLKNIIFIVLFLPTALFGLLLSILYTVAGLYICAFECMSLLARRWEWWSTDMDPKKEYLNNPFKETLAEVWIDASRARCNGC